METKLGCVCGKGKKSVCVSIWQGVTELISGIFVRQSVCACPWINLSQFIVGCVNGCFNARMVSALCHSCALGGLKSSSRKRSEQRAVTLCSHVGIAWKYSRQPQTKNTQKGSGLQRPTVFSPPPLFQAETWFTLWSFCSSALTGSQSMLSRQAKNTTTACLQNLVPTGVNVFVKNTCRLAEVPGYSTCMLKPNMLSSLQ